MSKTVFLIFFLVSHCLCLRLAGENSQSGIAEAVGSGKSGVWRSERNCGLNCAFVMLGMSGVGTDYAELESGLELGEDGSSLYDICTVLKRRGLNVEMAQCSPVDIPLINCPFIAHLDLNDSAGLNNLAAGHYIVVLRFEVNPKKVVYIDGTTGTIEEMETAQFLSRWSGATILLRTEIMFILWKIVIAIVTGSLVASIGYWLLFIKRPVSHGKLSKIAGLTALVFAAFVATGEIRAEENTNLLADTIQGIDNWQHSIQSLEVQFRFSSLMQNSVQDTIAKLGKLEIKEGRETFKLKGEFRRLERHLKILGTSKELEARLSDGKPLPEKARSARSDIRSFNGHTYREQHKITGLVMPATDIPQNTFQTMILVNIGFLPKSICSNAQLNAANINLGLPSALRQGRYSASLTDDEADPLVLFEGSVEAGPDRQYKDKIWISKKKLAVVRREIFGNAGELSIRFVNRDFIEAWPGVWFPRLSDCEEFGPGNTASPLVTNRIEVDYWRINECKDSDFDLSLRPGTMVSDFSLGSRGNPTVYTIPLEAKDLDAVIRQAVSGRPTRRPFLVWILAGSTAIGIAIWTVLIIRKRRLDSHDA